MGHEVEISEEGRRDRLRLGHSLDRHLLRLRDRLVVTPMCGDQIQRRLIPEKFARDFSLTNLWRAELPGAHRVIYTLAARRGGPTIVKILRILSHKEYDRLFGYSTS